MDIYGLNVGWQADPELSMDGLTALANRLNAGGESYQAALVTYLNLDWQKQAEVQMLLTGATLGAIEVDSYRA